MKMCYILKLKLKKKNILSIIKYVKLFYRAHTVIYREGWAHSLVEVSESQLLCSAGLVIRGLALPSGGHHSARCPELPTLYTPTHMHTQTHTYKYSLHTWWCMYTLVNMSKPKYIILFKSPLICLSQFCHTWLTNLTCLNPSLHTKVKD